MIVFLDSNVLIYLIEGDPNLAARVKESIVEQLDSFPGATLAIRAGYTAEDCGNAWLFK